MHGILLAATSAAGEAPVEGETRRRVYEALLRFPGLRTADLARQCRLAADLVDYHLRILQRRGLATRDDSEGRSRHYPAQARGHPIDRRDRPLLAALRRPATLRIVLHLLESGTASMGELAKQSGVSPATVSHHGRRLADAGVLDLHREGRTRVARLVDPERVTRLLRDHPPPADAIAGFAEMWEDLDL